MNFAVTNYPIIVHCHLPWNGVWQRPQQFHSRLSKRHPILFVEGPIPVQGLARSHYRTQPAPDYPGVTILQMDVPEEHWPDGKFIDAERRRLLDQFLRSKEGKKFQRPVQWFYDPMAVPSFADGLDHRAIVYDCMDQLSQFKFAPPEIIEREKALLKVADVVFAGGPKMHKSKSQHHSNCHCFGCGVDTDHFGKARHAETPIPEDIRHLDTPILGFFGVVDERMDYELMGKLAQANKNWNVVVIGPAAKVNPADFPRSQNLHWLGRREYTELPGYCKAFNVCLLPFAINEATEFINPTKALEYMATATPIVSTAIEDVVLQFSNVVRIARNHDQFIKHCLELVERQDPGVIERGAARAQQTSWEAIVQDMERHIESVLARKNTTFNTVSVGKQQTQQAYV